MADIEHNPQVLGDSPTDDDKLGFAEPAAHLADKIAGFPADKPMVVGIEGKWGEGKSSFLLMMEKSWRERGYLAPKDFRAKFGQFIQEKILRKKPAKQIKLIKFDPWWFSGKENLLDKLLKELEGQEPWWRLKLRALLSSLEKQANTENKWVNGGVNVMALALASWARAILNPILDWLGGDALISIKSWLQDGRATAALVLVLFFVIQFLLKQFIAWLSPPEGFDARKEKLKELLEKDRFQRVVFVDDLDRLPADELQEMFRVIKSVTNFPNVVYVLAYDRIVVSSALDKFHPDRGELFLEKIVQMPFALPEPTQHARSKTYEELFSDLPIWKEACKAANQTSTPDWHTLIFNAMIPNLRQAKRLRDALLHSQDHAMRIKPDIYVFLEALRLHNKDMCEKLCRAMLGFRDYPNNQTIANQTMCRSVGENKEKFSGRVNAQEKWMLQSGLLDKTFSLASPKIIECIAFFTKTPFSKPDEGIYEYRLPSKQAIIGGVDFEALERDEICRAFRCYLQAKYSEDDPTDAKIEQILRIKNKQSLIQFISEWPSVNHNTCHVLQHAISSYLNRLPASEKSERLQALHLLAQLTAETAEENMRCTPGYFGKNIHSNVVCKSIFLAVAQHIPRNGPHEELNFRQLRQYLEENAPLFAFDYCRGLYIPEGKAIGALLRKYPPSYILPLLDISTTPYCIGTFWELFTKSQISISSGLSEWLAEIPDQEALSEEQNNHLMCWMLESLQQERLSSRLFHQPKLAHLIEPLQQKLEKEGDAVTRELLDQILQQTPPTN